MNPSHEIARLLEESGAVLVRHKKHLVYRLPNGQTYTCAKTASDHRAERNNLGILRHALGLQRETPQITGERKVQQPQPAPAPPRAALKEKIESAITSEEAIQEQLLAEAQIHERRVQMLKALLLYAEDPLTEDALRSILPAVEPPVSRAPVVPPPPDAITERIQVTRQLVLAATQTFDGTFTVNDVMALMVNGHQINPDERGRVRASIAQAMVTLHERGELAKEQEHFGRRQTVWRKAQFSRSGHSSEMGTRA